MDSLFPFSLQLGWRNKVPVCTALCTLGLLIASVSLGIMRQLD